MLLPVSSRDLPRLFLLWVMLSLPAQLVIFSLKLEPDLPNGWVRMYNLDRKEATADET